MFCGTCAYYRNVKAAREIKQRCPEHSAGKPLPVRATSSCSLCNVPLSDGVVSKIAHCKTPESVKEIQNSFTSGLEL